MEEKALVVPSLPDETQRWLEDGKYHTRDGLCVKSGVPVYTKDHVPSTYVFGKPFLTTLQLSKKKFQVRRMHEWCMLAFKAEITVVEMQEPSAVFLRTSI